MNGIGGNAPDELPRERETSASMMCGRARSAWQIVALTCMFLLSLSATAAYIDPVSSPTISGLRGTGVSQMVGLSNAKVAMLIGSGTATPSIKVVNVDGSQVYSTSLASTLGARANNYSYLALYPIANGELIVTVEGTTNGCDNSTNNLFAFLRLSITGAVVTPLTNVSASTNSYNCYTQMAELPTATSRFPTRRRATAIRCASFKPTAPR